VRAEKVTEGLTLVSTRHSAPQFPLNPYTYVYYQIYGSSTTNLLPHFGNHLAPDGMHTLFDIFVIAVVVTLVLYLRSLRPQRSSIQRPP
jgi:hypothetical protein